MSGPAAIATGVAFSWLGMVLAISFLEAPLKFRAAGLELEVGLAIGRLVFRALNMVEVVLAAALLVCLVLAATSHGATTAAVLAVVILAVQLTAVRPRLNRRTDRILGGQAAPRSRSHTVYIATEAAKLAALLGTGVLLLRA